MDKKVRQNLERYIDISDDEWALFRSKLNLLSVSRGEHLVKAGQKTDRIYFIIKGALRTYYMQDDKEKNYNFHFEDDWYAPYYSILTQQPCNLSVQALEDTTMFYITLDSLHSLYASGLRWERLGRLMAEKSFIEKEEKEERFRFNSSEEHYKLLLAVKPNFIHRVPQYHLASFLGITPETLSRIRHRLHKK